MTGEALRPLDAAFIHLDSAAQPMHMGSIGFFDGAGLRDGSGRPRLDDLRAQIENRLHLVPKLRQRVVASPLREAPPTWVDDDRFDIANHVRLAEVPAPGSEDQLLAVCEDLLATPLDLDRPLWEVWMVDGLAGGRVAIVDKLHHAMADGLAGVELVTVIFDFDVAQPAPRPAPAWEPVGEPPAGLKVARDLGRLAAVPLRGALFALDCLGHPVRHLGRAVRVADALRSLTGPHMLAPRLSINVPVSKGRRLAVVRLSLEDLRQVGHTFGVTVNDVLLAVVARGVGTLLASRGEPVTGREVHLMVPVGFEHDTEHHVLGNRVSTLVVRAPLGALDPVARLRAVADDVGRDKVHHQQLAAQAAFGLLEPLPQSALAGVTGLVGRQPLVNLVVTNVPGPPVALSALGATMTEAVAFVPIAGNLSLGVAALSYLGQLTLGVLADRSGCPDLDEFAKGLSLGAAELVEAARHAAAEADDAARRAARSSGNRTRRDTPAP
ncbi:MAG: wax ester/triacylglycerol synthase family O-acyltransferase [Acidimicrobiales bacterium]